MRAILAGLVFLGGCAALHSADPASPYYAYGAGWTLQLHRPLTIPAHAATVRLQYGRIVPRNGVQEHDPFCVMELSTVRDLPQTVLPGRFGITRVTRRIDPISAAAASPFLRTAHQDSTPSFLYYVTEFRLHDAASPGLYSLRCAWDQRAPGNQALMRHLAQGEIRAALGDWVTLHAPGELP